MSNKVKSLGHEMQRVIDLGLIDHWLRGLCDIVPRALSRFPRDDSQAFNTHMIAFDCIDTIAPAHVQGLTGCRQLLTGCSQQNVGIEINFIKDGHLCVVFQPENQFKSSVVFGNSYHNVLPTLFGLGKGRKNKV